MDSRGGVGFCESKGVYGRAIVLAERFRHPINGGSQWSHVFCSLGDGTVVEAVSGGVRYGLLVDVAARGPTKIVPCPGDPEKFIDFHRKQLGKKYGWLTIVSQVVDLLTPDWFPSFRRPGTWDCSGLTAAAFLYSGAYYDFRDIYAQRPSDIEGLVCG